MDASGMLTTLPMLAMSAMIMMGAVRTASVGMRYLMIGVMVFALGGGLIGQLSRGGGQRKRKLKGERRDYLRYLGQLRRTARRAAELQAQALQWNHPAPEVLWSIAATRRMWERRSSHGDFGEVRLGTGPQRLSVQLSPPQTKPVEDLEPLCISGLRRYVETYRTVPSLPISIQLRDFARVIIRGPEDSHRDDTDDDVGRAIARSIIAQLVTFHAPEDLQIVICASPAKQVAWDWVKWLPHAQHQTESDGCGNRRLVTESFAELERLLGGQFMDRPRFEDRSPVSKDEPYILIVVDDVPLPTTARVAGTGVRNCTVLDISESLRWTADTLTLRLRADAERVSLVSTEPNGKEVTSTLCRPDLLSYVAIQMLSRRLAPYRIGTSTEAVNPMAKNFDLMTLMGLGDPRGFDLTAARSQKSRWDLLRIPIGVTESGSPVELDLKEAAQGGMGPHGILIGATGSGKSELLRTLVLALAIRHSSELLNFVLVDFKGGATFLGFDRLPHTSAMITNLSDELPLVDRMQEALQGELVRRQELLRKAGFASARDYAKALADGAVLQPLPTLIIIVDEFSELLSSKREFIDLFVMIGRLGRSLGVHLLLASQRIDEGRMHALESHLSYRIGLRTFSAMESRSVIGVPHAYELPSAPGNGYLRPDTTSLIRFKAAYVSAPHESATPQRRESEVRRRLVPYSLGFVEAPDADEPLEETAIDEPVSTETLLDLVVTRLADVGAQAHRVWLPPLAKPPTLDQLLPALRVDPQFGLTTADWSGRGALSVPVGIIDRPTEQRRDPLLADLTGSGGHVGIVGGPQSGKSTLLRSLVMSLALTHTPREVQLFCLDFGGGALSTLAGLPHVGSVTGRLDPERVGRTIAEAKTLLAERERRFAEQGVDSIAAYRELIRAGTLPPDADDAFGDLFLVVDGWGTLRQDFEQLEGGFSELATNGLNYGIHLVVTATRWSEIRPWLRDLLGTRFELHLGDPIESEIGMRLAANVPAIPGRGLTREAAHFLAAVPRTDGIEADTGLSEAVRSTAQQIAQAWSGPTSPGVRLLPATLPSDQLPASDGNIRIPLGLDEEQLAPVWHDFEQVPHLMIFGDTESGKTNVLRHIMRSITTRYTPDEARIIIGDSRRDLYDAVPSDSQLSYAVSGPTLNDALAMVVDPLTARLPGPEVSPEQLRRQDWWEGPRLFVVVDDYDLLTGSTGSPLAKLVDLVAQGGAIGLHVIMARTSAGAARAVMMDQFIRQLWDLGAPALMFSCGKEEGAFLGNAKPLRLVPGRAQLVTRRHAPILLQTSFCPAEAVLPG
jgi:S-DNA-T family DNA segregation ATPase FtsK/SpoIIIE